jgi:CubicO group peptidase (beta-lactamase class C family)
MIGELYLNDGVHEGRRIIQKEWIEASWQAYSNHENTDLFTRPGSGYGYQWWTTILEDTRDRSFPTYYADGWAHQFILIVPQLDLVVVSVAEDYEYSGPGSGSTADVSIIQTSGVCE